MLIVGFNTFNLKEFIGEFKAFAIKGNVIDLAIAVIIGVAFDCCQENLLL